MSGTRAVPMTREALGNTVRSDLSANRGYPKSAVILCLFRAAQYARTQPGPRGRLLHLVAGSAYKLLAEWVLGVELPASTHVGPGLRLRHGVGLVVNPYAVIGANVMLRHGVTIGNRTGDFDCPIIGRDVEIGAGATLIGAIRVGDGARIGAGAVVVSNVPSGGVAMAPPATVRPPRASA